MDRTKGTVVLNDWGDKEPRDSGGTKLEFLILLVLAVFATVGGGLLWIVG